MSRKAVYAKFMKVPHDEFMRVVKPVVSNFHYAHLKNNKDLPRVQLINLVQSWIGHTNLEEASRALSLQPAEHFILMDNEIEAHYCNNLIQVREGDLGYDIRAGESVTVHPWGSVIVDTKMKICLPPYLGAFIKSRSGLAFKHNIEASNAGTIDPNFRGSVKVILRNYSDMAYDVTMGDRIAQMVFQFDVNRVMDLFHSWFKKVDQGEEVFIPQFDILESDAENWDKTERMEAGYGSSGN